jgi:hypothetical protein
MKDYLFKYGDRAALIKYAKQIEGELENAQNDLMETEAHLMNLQIDLAANLAHRIRQVTNQPTPLHIVKDEKHLADKEK